MRNTLRFATYALVTSAAFVSFSGQALAAQPGILTWTASDDVLSSLDYTLATVSPDQQVRFVETSDMSGMRTELTVGFNASLVPNISDLQSASSQGAITFTMSRPLGKIRGGSLTLSNFRVDVAGGQFLADAVGSPAGGDGFAEQGVRLAGLIDAHSSNGQITFATLDDQFSDLLAKSWGGEVGGARLAIPYSMGTITVSAVPEPSTYVMFLLGVCGLAAAARRR